MGVGVGERGCPGSPQCPRPNITYAFRSPSGAAFGFRVVGTVGLPGLRHQRDAGTGQLRLRGRRRPAPEVASGRGGADDGGVVLACWMEGRGHDPQEAGREGLEAARNSCELGG